MPISPQLLEILACPLTKAPVVMDGEWIISTDAATRRKYPIKDDIPIMLIEESIEMSPEEWKEAMKRNQIPVS